MNEQNLLGLEEFCLVLIGSELPSVLFRGDGDLILKRSKESREFL